MSFFDELIISTVFILFSNMVYLIYFTNKENEKHKNTLFDLCIFISVYLIIRFSNYSTITILLINIPFLLSIIKKRKKLSIILSIIFSIYLHDYFNFNIIYIFLEYMLYFGLFYKILDNKKYDAVEVFVLIKSFIMTMELLFLSGEVNEIITIVDLTFSFICFYLATIFIIYLIEKSEEIISYNKIMKELNKEKQIKASLFKITHEVKNPLSVCKGYLSMMNYNNIEKVKKYNKIIESEINRTLDIMDAFSEYSKINIKKEEVEINEFLKEVFEASQILLSSKNINLKCEKNNNRIFVNMDPNRMKQVMVNLIKNSSEAIEESGNILIKVEETKKKIKIIVEDDGCGMDEQTLNDFQNIFYTTKSNGTGIGTALCNEIIDLHNGNLSYYSKKGVGTKAIITLIK